MKQQIDFNLLAEWNYSEKDWNEFVEVEKASKKEDNFYFGIAIVILGSIVLMLLRNTSFLIALVFSIPFAFFIPWLRMKFSYKYLKKGIKNPSVKIFSNYLLINGIKIELSRNQKRIKSLKIIESKNKMNLLEFDVQWLTRKGPTNDEYRVLIPSDKIEEANLIVKNFYT
jgi:5-bromo-4-chloroindolyl phosphate hydrolysis protein